MKSRISLVWIVLVTTLGTAAAGDFVDNDVTSFGTFRGVPFERHTGRFEGTTSLGFFSMPYEIVVPAPPHRGNRTLLIEPPHFFFVATARDWVLGEELLFDRGFSYGTRRVVALDDGGSIELQQAERQRIDLPLAERAEIFHRIHAGLAQARRTYAVRCRRRSQAGVRSTDHEPAPCADDDADFGHCPP